MNEVIDTIDYKNCVINIYQDNDTQSPDEWGDEGLFLVSFHRDFWIQRDGFGKEVCQALAGDADGCDEYTQEKAKGIKKRYHMFGLEAYIHGMVTLGFSNEGNFPDRQWDVSQCGLIFVSKEYWKKRESAKHTAESLIKEWNDYLSGNVYGYVAETKDGYDGGSCWGFYGDYRKSGLLDSAKSDIDSHLKEQAQKKSKKVKAYIKNHVPFEKRI